MQAPSSYFDPLSPASPACAPPTTDIPPRGVSHAAVISPGAPVLPPLPPAAPPSLPGMVIPPMPGASNGAPLTPGPQSTTYNPPMPYNPPAPPPTMSSAPNPSQTTTSNSNQTMEPFRSNWLALLDNQLATDTVLVCGPEATEIPCHRAVLISQSAYFRSKLSGDTLPPRMELPDIQAGAVKLFLRFIYSGLPAAMDCLSDPVLAVDVLHAIEELAASEPDLTRWRAARRAIEGQLIELMGSENAGKGLARLNRYGMRGTFEACLPLYMQAAKNDPTRTVGLLEGMDYGAFLHAVKSADWPGGEMQKFRICRAWAEVNRASSEQKMELAKLIDLERITLDDLEKEVEPSGLIPIQKLMKQYTAVARRIRAQAGLPGGSQVSLRQQILGTSGSELGMPQVAQTQQPQPQQQQQQIQQQQMPMPMPNASMPGMPMMLPPGSMPVPQQQQFVIGPNGQPMPLPPGSMMMQQPQQQYIMPPQTNGLLNNGQPMNLVPLGNGTTAVVGNNGVVMNSLPPGTVTLATPQANAVVPLQTTSASQTQPEPAPPQQQPRASTSSQRSRRTRDLPPEDLPMAPAAPVQPSTVGGDISAGFESWLVPRPDITSSRSHLDFRSDSIRSCRSAVGLTRGQWRWVIMIEKVSPRQGSGAGASYLPDVGIMIGDTFDPRLGLRAQPNCCAWDGRDSICVNSMPIPYPRSRGGPLKDGEVIVVDLDLDARTLGFRRNGVDCGTSIRGFPGTVYLAVCGRYPARIRWVGLSHVA